MDGALTGQGNDLLISQFWEKWTEYQDQLYRCCLKLMNSNPTDAEDALSQAMLKAWEKVQKYAGKIDNLKAWLFKLTSNLCIDIIRARSRGAVGVESIEWVGDTEEMGIGSTVASPETCLEREEKSTEIQQAIANLPETLRETFILHFYQELTHTEIAQRQGISYDNVCRRIYRARIQLKEKLSGYFRGAGEDVISSPVEHLDFGGKKAEPTPNPSQEGNRRQMAEEKEEGCKLDSHELSFTTFAQRSPQEQEENSGVSASPCPRVPASALTKGIQEDMILVGDGDSNGQNKIGIKEVIVEKPESAESFPTGGDCHPLPREETNKILFPSASCPVGEPVEPLPPAFFPESSVASRELAAPTVRETGMVSVGTCNPNRRTIKGEPPQKSPMYPFGLSGNCWQQRFRNALSIVFVHRLMCSVCC